MLRPFLLALSLGVASPVPAQTADDRTAAQAVITQFDTDTRANDLDGLIQVMPPLILATMAAGAGLEVAELRASMRTEMEQLLAQVEILEYSMDLDAGQGGVTDTGRPYFLVPTFMLMEVVGAGRIRATSDTLAFEDDGQWWLMRVENLIHERMLAMSYPDLASIDFQPGTMEVVE